MQGCIVPNLKDLHFFRHHKILKEWIAALVRRFIQCQSTLILVNRMAFQSFWLALTVVHTVNTDNWFISPMSKKTHLNLSDTHVLYTEQSVETIGN